MTEPTLVELIEAYDIADKACSEWISSGYPASGLDKDGNTPCERRYDLEGEMRRRLHDLPGRGVTWNGAVYALSRGGLTVVRNLRSADEIDREARS